MEEHKLLTGMLLVALVVGIGGTMIAVDHLNGLNSGVTGAATGTGTSYTTVAEDITISIPNSTVDFGSGSVDVGSDWAVLSSSSFRGTHNGSWANISDNISIQNDGNRDINVTVNASKINGSRGDAIICDPNCPVGTSNQTNATMFEFTSDNLELNACSSGAVGQNTAFESLEEHYDICTCLQWEDHQDTLGLFLDIGVPSTAAGITHSVDFVFTSSSLTQGC
ncbi:hypothetical protein HOC01_06550 [archaeon]|jgi:hypothetical protein|nr:hypothetical protein [archaeon]MBT6697499.1 hypothetical protein [archaeon]